MGPSPSKGKSRIHPYVLSRQELRAIGRVVRAVAELDELTNLYVNSLACLEDWQAQVILGRMQTSARLKIAGTIAETQGPIAIKVHKDFFDNPTYRAIIKFRNTVTHGILLGKDDNGKIAFAVQEIAGTDDDIIFGTVNAYEPKAFEGFAELSEKSIKSLEHGLQLTTLREKLREQALSPHPKALRSKTLKPKRAAPPQSSPG